MAYIRTNWVNGVTAANQTNMNNIESWIEKADAALNVDTTNGKISQLELALGTIARISKFTASLSVGSQMVNHGLGVVPDFVIFTWNLTSTPAAATVGHDPASATTTQVKIWSSIAANVIGLAIAF